MRTKTTLTLALCGLLGAAGAAAAQSYTAPAGRDPSTAPGGTEGIAGPRNEAESIRSGDAVAVPPRRGGVAVEEPAGPPPGTYGSPASR
ncbi:hypothetical protein MKK69_23425 [Methylobacterium sp. J-026]|uniref:hypothetical protein n=1 Tax=Methylobacterium sp. J-026 TaxID=2836624 RepID=UPI001FBB6C58|nr:hypothetical protein [Methylobacterium sp. J-026]MCJ2136963.1 hypothetical protein [Methylobacterium sp. J-026]